MVEKKDSEAVLLLTILQEKNAKRARRQYLKAFDIEEIGDQAIYDLVEEQVFDAIVRNEPTVEIERGLAQVMLLLLKNGIKRSRGGQRNSRTEKMRKRTLVQLGRRIKAELVADGRGATQAHLQAAEEAAEEGRKRGLDFTDGYLGREMQKTNKSSRQ